MATNINTLLGMGLSPQDDMNALASSLRGEQGMGDYWSMSTLPGIAKMGQNMQQRSGQAAKQGGVLRQAMAKERQAQQNYNTTALAKTQAAKKLADTKASERDLKSFWHPTKKDTVLNLERADDGNYYDQTGEVYDPNTVQTLTPYETGSTASKQGKLSKTEKDTIVTEKKQLRDRGFVSSRLSSPHMAGATGSLASVGTLLPGAVGINPKSGSLQTDLSNMTVQQAADPLSHLGVNPTDKDLEFALKASRTLGSQPESWRDWYRDIYTPEIERLLNQYAAEGGYNAEEEIAKWREESQATLADMNENIELESGKGIVQRFEETFDESKTESYKARQTAPQGVNAEQWAGLSDDDKDYYLKNMVN